MQCAYVIVCTQAQKISSMLQHSASVINSSWFNLYPIVEFIISGFHNNEKQAHKHYSVLLINVSRRLRSSDTFTFVVPWTRTRLGDRSFAVAGPQI